MKSPLTTHTVQPTAAQVGPSTNPNHLSPVDIGLASFVVTFPVLLVIAIAGYRNYRCRLLHLQISALERMWNLNHQEQR